MTTSVSQSSVATALFSQLPIVMSPLLQSISKAEGVSVNTGGVSSPSMMILAETVVSFPQLSVAVQETRVELPAQRLILKSSKSLVTETSVSQRSVAVTLANQN